MNEHRAMHPDDIEVDRASFPNPPEYALDDHRQNIAVVHVSYREWDQLD